jgi:trans-feruloyl-CoA hydratase/vanillin synthase
MSKMVAIGDWKTVKVEIGAEGIAWITLNRPEKRNAMNPTLNREMIDVLETVEQDARAKVVVLTGAGDAWTAGMDLKEYFREIDAGPEILQEKIRREAGEQGDGRYGRASARAPLHHDRRDVHRR